MTTDRIREALEQKRLELIDRRNVAPKDSSVRAFLDFALACRELEIAFYDALSSFARSSR